jgi:hypothetical protein
MVIKRYRHASSIANYRIPADHRRDPRCLPGRWRWCDRPWLCDAQKSKRASHIDPPASSYAIMRRACPYRGENHGPQAHATIGPLTTLMLYKQDLPRAPATAVALCDSSRQSTTSTGWAPAAPARPAVTDVTAIIFVCWPCRSTTYRSARSAPAARSNEKHANMLSPKRPWSGSISDNVCCLDSSSGKGPLSTPAAEVQGNMFLAPALDFQLVTAFEIQDFARVLRRRHLKPEALDDFAGEAHLFGVGCGHSTGRRPK